MTLLFTLLACAPCDGDGMCRVDDGRYLAVRPDSGKGPYPVLLFFHGYNSSPEKNRDKKTVTPWREEGYLTVFPEGEGGSWSNVGSPQDTRDELAFTASVLADVAEEFDVDGRVVVTGHSQGSSMAWDVACYRPDLVDALVGSAGSFWVPEPASCEASRPVRHSHGTSDGVMPMEGRAIGSYHQGDVYEGIESWKVTNGCAGDPTVEVEDGVTCEVWSCTGDEVRLCLHDGGHGAPNGLAERSIPWVESVLP